MGYVHWKMVSRNLQFSLVTGGYHSRSVAMLSPRTEDMVASLGDEATGDETGQFEGAVQENEDND
jgi:hypothetical protein